MINRWWAAIAVLTMAGLAAATRSRPPPAVDATAGSVRSTMAAASYAPAAPELATTDDAYDPSPFPHRTTTGSIARGNLDGRIDSLTGWSEHDRQHGAETQKPLVEALLSRTQFFGTFSDFDRALALAGTPSKTASAAELELWALVESALHEFSAALDALSAAERLDGKPRDAARATIHLALGSDLQSVLQMREKAVAAAPGFESLSGLAAAQAALGRFDAADATYRKALSSYRDVSPFPVAWVEFQRGVMWAESAGRADRAIPVYRDAVSRLPGYVVATVHLAELEADAGQSAIAVERLQPLAGEVEDPEPAAVLAKLLSRSDPPRAGHYAAIAKRGYERLLAKHPNAFLDHAAEFFAAAGNDPRRALALAEENLKLRRTDRAYLLAIRCARAAGDTRRACALSRAAGDDRPSVPLSAARREALSGCDER